RFSGRSIATARQASGAGDLRRSLGKASRQEARKWHSRNDVLPARREEEVVPDAARERHERGGLQRNATEETRVGTLALPHRRPRRRVPAILFLERGDRGGAAEAGGDGGERIAGTEALLSEALAEERPHGRDARTAAGEEHGVRLHAACPFEH